MWSSAAGEPVLARCRPRQPGQTRQQLAACLPSRAGRTGLPHRYGGILLGPARFTHINNTARELLDACGYIASKEGRSGGGKGRKG